MIPFLLPPQIFDQKTDCIVYVRVHDRISAYQMEACLRRKGIQVGEFGQDFGNKGFFVSAPPKQVTKILTADAPEEFFAIGLTRYRKAVFSLPEIAWSRARSVADLNAMCPDLKITETLAAASVKIPAQAPVSYRMRPFIGLDLKSHTGIEILYLGATYQLLEDGNKITLENQGSL